MSLAAAAGITLAAMPASAGPIYTFSVSAGTQPTNVGTITLTQSTANSVVVGVDLLPTYGFINTGGPHTPFTFNLSGSGTLGIAFTTPLNGIYASGVFSLNTGGGSNTPYGSFGIAVDSSAGNGSGAGYFGDLLFTLTRTGGLDTGDFVTNSDGYYFAADLSDGTNTGAQAWATRTTGTTVITEETAIPEPATLSLFGMGLLGIAGAAARRRKAKA